MTAVATKYLPPPAPITDPAEQCEQCRGRGVLQDQYVMEASPAVHLLIDVLCPACGGCGRAAHNGCSPIQHAEWDPEEDEPDEWHDQEHCLSCRGRRWNAVQSFAGESDGEVVLNARVPCGCAEPDLVDVGKAGTGGDSDD